MILTKLKEYADTQMSLPPQMYGETKVRWLLDLKPDGTRQGWLSLGGDTKATKRGIPVVAPHVMRTAGVKPKLLADTGEYVLGIGRPGAKPKRVADCHQQFKALIQECAVVTQEPSVQAIAKFLDSWEPERDRAELPDNFDPSDVVTFQVSGIIPADAKAQLRSIEAFWADYTARGSDQGMTCLVTGKFGPVEQRLPFPIRGIPGGKPSGTALVSANVPPFTSYGLQNSLTSPISRDAAERFAKALNHLIATPKSRLYIGSTVYVFWTSEPTEFNPLTFLDKPEPQAVKDLHKTGSAPSCYALALTAGVARAVVRDWLETNIVDVENNLRNWFEAQRIIGSYGEPGKPLGVYALTASAYRDASQEMSPAFPTALVRVALYGGQLPNEMLARLIRRNRVEGDVTYPRAALIKLILTTQEKVAKGYMDTLNPHPDLEDSDRAAYNCGRILAGSEAFHWAARGLVRASLNRYYALVSSTPASAFPLVMRGVRAYVAKLRQTSPRTCVALEKRLEEITSNLSDFPKTLTMHQQGFFALGYYHQRAANRAAAKVAKTT